MKFSLKVETMTVNRLNGNLLHNGDYEENIYSDAKFSLKTEF